MKVEPVPPQIATRRLAIANEQAGPSFETALSEAARRTGEDGHRAFGFLEFGMFGRLGSVSPALAAGQMDAIGDAASAGAGESSPGPGPAAAAARPYAGPDPDPELTNRRLSLGTQGAGTVRLGRLSAALTAASNMVPATPANSRSPAAAETANSARKSSAPAVPPKKAERSNSLSVLISEVDGAVEIFAAAPEMDGRERQRLRKMSAEILSEFDVDLSLMSLNGRLLEHSLFTSIGGLYGNRTR